MLSSRVNVSSILSHARFIALLNMGATAGGFNMYLTHDLFFLGRRTSNPLLETLDTHDALGVRIRTKPVYS